VVNYHQLSDDFEHLNRATAWHYLQTIMKLADYTANNPLPYVNATPVAAIYFPFFPGNTLLVTMTAANIFAVLACILAIVFMVLQWVKKELKVSFSLILLILLIVLTIALTLLFPAAGYLASMPLLLLTITMALKKQKALHLAASMVSGVIALLIWIPVLILVWQALIAPMML
jgi:uncharacterized membrane protein